MGRRGGLAVYVTSHGFGHLNRTVAVLNRVPADVAVDIHCHPNLFEAWRQRLVRDAGLHEHVSDSGAVNPPGDSAATDGPASIAAARSIYETSIGRVDAEAEALRASGAAAVLCDAPPLPLVAARRAGIPGFLLANFTWADIYGPHARNLGGDAPAFVAEVHRAYQDATALFRAEPALPMEDVAPIIEVGMVCSAGVDRGAELRGLLKLSSSDKLVYFYVGRYGQADMDWHRLAEFAGVHFVAFHPAPGHDLPNLHVVAPEHWTGADLAASADAMVVKAGYGTACEAMAAGTPMIYPPRVGFAEHEALDRALTAWGGGVPTTEREFNELRLGRALDRAFSLKPGPPPFPADGADRVAGHLTAVCRGETDR
ncbi:hypothetical protein EP7_002770 [Isosphaeraceae bacterium EP7]